RVVDERCLVQPARRVPPRPAPARRGRHEPRAQGDHSAAQRGQARRARHRARHHHGTRAPVLPESPVTRRLIAVVVCGALAVVLTMALWGCGASTIPAVHSEAERMSTARRMIERKNWVSAQELLKGYIKNNPGSADIDQAVYLLGLCYLNNHDYAQATTE